MDNRHYKRPFIFILIAVIVVIIATAVISLLPKLSPRRTDPPVQTTPAPTQGPIVAEATTTSSHGMILSNDREEHTITMTDLDRSNTVTITYTGHTEVLTSYGKRISARLLKPGDFIRATYDNSHEASAITGSDSVWTYKNVRNLVVDADIARMSIGGSVYHYNDDLHIMLDDRFLTMADLSTMDTFNIYGVDNYIYLIKVATGHGFLSLANWDDYVGGTLYINGDVYCQISSDMRPITLSEGEYNIAVENKKLFGDVDIRISPFDTTTFDLSPYSSAPVEACNVTFSITPSDASLYIDGVRTTFRSPVSLSYGTHSIEAELGGYMTFKSSFTANRSAMVYSINLPQSPEKTLVAEVDDDVLYDEDEYDDDYSEDPGIDPLYVSYDDNCEMTVYCTEASTVYINGLYVGIIRNGSLTFPKPQAGFVTIRFDKDGFKSATHALTIEDDDSDPSIAFPELEPLR